MNRRSFLIKGTSVLALGFAMPSVLERTVFARALDGVSAATVDKTLVVIELNGGIDGLNVVIPLNNAAYRSARPNLNVVEATALPLTTDLGLNAYLRQQEREMREFPVTSETVLYDLDTPEDYERLRREWR